MAEFPGMTKRMSSMPANDVALPSALVPAYAAQQQQTQISQMQQTAMMSGQINQAFAEILTELRQMTVNAQSANAAVQASQSPSLADPATLPTRAPAGPGGPAGSQSATRPSATPEEKPHTARRRFEEGAALLAAREEGEHSKPAMTYAEGKNASMKSIAQKAESRVAAFISSRTSNWNNEDQPDGTKAWVHYDKMTSKPDRPIVGESDPKYAKMTRTIGRSQSMAQGMTKLAEGGGVGELGSLGAIATKVAGPIGLAVGAATMIRSQLESQNTKAADYRGDFGQQGTGNFAASDRMAELGASIKGWGTIGGERARDQFKQASAMGLRGQRRDSATQFSTDMFMKFGIDTTESMQMVQDAVDGGNISLSDYGKAINDVSKAAVAAGKDSKKAVEDFRAANKTVTTDVVIGDAGLKVTKGLDKMVQKMDPNLQTALGGTSGVARLLSDHNVSIMASRSGQDPNIAISRLHNPDTASQQVGTFMSGLGEYLVQWVAGQLGMNPAELKAKVQQVTGGKMPANPQGDFQKVIGQNAEWVSGLILRASPIFGQQFGIQLTEAYFYELLFTACLGGFNSMAKANAAQAKSDAKPVKTMTASQAKKKLDTFNPSVNPKAASRGPAPQYLSTLSSTEKKYYTSVADGGKGNPIIESLLKHGDKIKEFSHQGLDQTKFRIQVGGKSLDLTLAEIMKNQKYMQALYSNQSSILSSDTNAKPEAITDVTGKIAPPASAAQPGTKPGDWSTSAGADGGKQEIGLRGDAAKYFQLFGGPSDAQRNGVPEKANWNPSGMFTWGGQ